MRVKNKCNYRKEIMRTKVLLPGQVHNLLERRMSEKLQLPIGQEVPIGDVSGQVAHLFSLHSTGRLSELRLPSSLPGC